MIDFVGQGQRAPTHVDPVVAFVHCGRRGQVEDRVRNGSIRNSRWALVPQRLDFWGSPRSVAVLAQHIRIRGTVMVSAVTSDAGHHGRNRRECQTGAMVARTGISTYADIPIVRIATYCGAGTRATRNDEAISVGGS